MKRKKCLLGYEVEIFGGDEFEQMFAKRVICSGIDACCAEFNGNFQRTLFRGKKGDDSLYARRANGLNLIAHGDTVEVVDYHSEPGSIEFTEKSVTSCPYCGAEIVIKRTRTTIYGRVIEKNELTEDGKEEETLLFDLSVLAFIIKKSPSEIEDMTYPMTISIECLQERLDRLEKAGYIEKDKDGKYNKKSSA